MQRVGMLLLVLFLGMIAIPGLNGVADAEESVISASSTIVITETAAGALKTTTPEAWWQADSLSGSIHGTIIHTEGSSLDLVLPAGVYFSSMPTAEVTSGDLELGDVSVENDRILKIEIADESNIASTITISNLAYTFLNQPVTGDVKAGVGSDYNEASNHPLANLNIAQIGSSAANYVMNGSAYQVNGTDYAWTAPPYIKNNRTYLAIRDIATGLGIDPADVIWDAGKQSVTLVEGEKVVQVSIGSTTMLVNGTAVPMDVAPEIGPDSRAMLPAAFVAQAFGAAASWDEATGTLTIK